MAAKPQLSTFEYLSLPVVVAKALLTLSYASLTGFARGQSGAATYKQHVAYSTLRTALSAASTRQLQAFASTTQEAYESFVAQLQKKIDPSIKPQYGRSRSGGGEGERETTHGFWFGNAKTAKKVLVWCHGGGYANYASAAHMQLLWNLRNAVNEASGSDSLAVFIVYYYMAPAAKYPAQLCQATAALKYLVEEVRVSPSQIILGGDSAGANLALALLSHLSHPHPELSIPRLSLSEPLAGTILVSPWVTFDQSAPAFQHNLYKDLLEGGALKRWSDDFMGEAGVDEYNHPRNASAAWWKDLGRVAGPLAVTAGNDELLVDDIKALVGTMKVQNPTLEYLEAPKEAHDYCLVQIGLGDKEDSASTAFMKKWLLERMGS